MIDVPPVVRSKAAQLGDGGARWLADLPVLLADLERRWSVTVGPPLAGGTEAYVARARTSDGSDAVVKVKLPAPGFADEVRTLADASGHGYVRLLAADPGRGAMLQEALGRSMSQLALPPEQALQALCLSLRRAWEVPRPTGAPVFGKAAQLDDLVRRLWRDLDHPCPEPVVALALEYAERRAKATDPDRCVVVHGDPHPGNALQVPTPRAGAESGYVFVDPDGFVDTPAYDLGVTVREWCRELLATPHPTALLRHYCRLVATATGHDEQEIWEWAYLERVSTGLYVLDLGAADRARPFLVTAARLLDDR